MIPVRGLAAVITLMLVLTACGVPAQDEPHQVKLPRSPLNRASSAPAPDPAGEVAQVLCLIRDNRLVQRVRRADAPLSPQRQLDLLIAGPTVAEQQQGLTTALATTGLTVTIPAGQTIAVVEVGERDEGAGRSDEAIAYGQIVCTLTSRGDVSAVVFREGGRPLQVPRGDSILSSDPLRAADYSSLIDPP